MSEVPVTQATPSTKQNDDPGATVDEEQVETQPEVEVSKKEAAQEPEESVKEAEEKHDETDNTETTEDTEAVTATEDPDQIAV